MKRNLTKDEWDGFAGELRDVRRKLNETQVKATMMLDTDIELWVESIDRISREISWLAGVFERFGEKVGED